MATRLRVGWLFLAISSVPEWTHALSAPLIYQGRLTPGGNPSMGTFEREFRLLDQHELR